MNSQIMPVPGPDGPTSAERTFSAKAGDPARFLAALDASERSLDIQAARSTPPSSLMDEIGAAGAAYDRLAAEGRSVRFAPQGQGHSIELHDDRTGSSTTITSSQAIDLARGGRGI